MTELLDDMLLYLYTAGRNVERLRYEWDNVPFLRPYRDQLESLYRQLSNVNGLLLEARENAMREV